MKIKTIVLVILSLALASLILTSILSKPKGLLTHQFQIGLNLEESIDQEYLNYLEKNTYHRPSESIILTAEHIDHLSSISYEVIDGETYGISNNLIFSDEIGQVTFLFHVEEEGFYNIEVDYFPIEGKSSRIERIIKINDEIPYRAAERISFTRIWVDQKSDFLQDANGNDIIPRQIEAPRFNKRVLTDSDGIIKGSLLFHFIQGTNSITFQSIKEPILFNNITIKQDQSLLPYQTYKQAISNNNNDVSLHTIIKAQGQHMHEKSSPTLYPIADRTSAANTPQSSFALRANAGGGFNWRVVGDWISYQMEVEEAGFYHISLRAKQSFIRGAYVTRQIRINGEIPFLEVAEVPFEYSGNFNLYTLGTDEPFHFYFEPGFHEISLEIVLGDFNTPIREVTEVINTLNRTYREIIMITTAQPDIYRDYQLEIRLPHMLKTFEETKNTLDRLTAEFIKMTGERSARTVILDRVSLQLANFLEKPETIHRRLSEYQNNVSALGAWILEIKEQPLTIDYIALHPVGTTVDNVHPNLFQSLSFSLLNFIASFLIDYNNLSSATEASRGNITVWLGTGRDQANIMRRMLDEDFTERTGIGVNLQLVSMDVLLPATLTRKGPDVAIGVGNQIPVNYAMRSAVQDLTIFDDFDEISTRFQHSAIVPYQYLDGVYALPETQIFPVMFYRQDILDELQIEIPETWEDVIKIIPELQRKNLDFFLPIDIVENVRGVLPPNLIYAMLLYQNGGTLYLDDGKRSGLQEPVALDAFKQWTDFYTNYRFQIQANFVNRFRSGEMPIGISYYSMYNTLTVFAPEISGNWSFTTVPGVRMENGEINNIVPTTGTGILLMNQSNQKDLAWEFMKWWTEEETQVRFGREMEGILGAAARYPTANIKALEKLPWPVNDLNVLRAQWENTIGIPEVPGGYFIGRHLDNALRRVINTGANPRDTLYEYANIIHNEIATKRREFNLDLED